MHEATRNPEDLRALSLEQLLRSLPGIYAANVQTDDTGVITEIHLLTTSSRSAKQTVRDARSALLSVHGLDVDHRLISVAQIGTELGDTLEIPATGEKIAPRLKASDVSQLYSREEYKVTVTLTQGDASFQGAFSARNTENQRRRAVAEATLRAVHGYLGKNGVFTLLSVHRASTNPVPVMVVIVEFLQGEEAMLLVGAAAVQGGEEESVVRATLDAINRKLAHLQI